MLIDIDSSISVVFINIALKGWESQLITVFEVTIILSKLLHCIIRQVYKGIVNIL